MSRRSLILRSFQSPGDILMMTAAVRDLHLAHPRLFETDVRTSADAIWLHNPFITRLSEGQPGVETIEMHYPLIHESNQRPYHFIHGYPHYLEQQLNLKIPVTRFCGDIHLSAEEKNAPPPGAELGVGEHFWIMMAGGKYDFTAKWWNPASYQKVVDHFQGRIQFVQCGEAGHWHPPLEGVVNLVGKTDTRSFIRLVHHADGIVCPVTFAMHLAAAVETKPGRPRHRPCVVIAGGREPPHWEAYPHHQFLSTVGALTCCADGGCWKSRCQPAGDGDMKDRSDLCVDSVQVRPDLRIARCMDLITPEHVIDRIELYYRGGMLTFGTNGAAMGAHSTSKQQVQPSGALPTAPESDDTPTSRATHVPGSPEQSMNVLVTFRHGLGDAVQLTSILKHLKKYRPTWNVDVAALVGKHSAYRGLCRAAYVLDRDATPCCMYGQRFNLDWHECHTVYADSPSTKADRCLREEFGIAPDPELCTYSIDVGDEARKLARDYLEQICPAMPDAPHARADARYPVVLIHYEGNTSADMKNIPTDVIRRLCDDIIGEGFVPVILDWDFRTPLADGVRIHCPDQRAELWGRTGTGDAETLAALIEQSTLFVGVDSGPLHVAGATSTPTLGVWTRHHPLHFFAHADNVTHLVPTNCSDLLRGDRTAGEKYFSEHYRFQNYDDVEKGLRSAVQARLRRANRPAHEMNGRATDIDVSAVADSSLVLSHDFWVRSDMAEQDLVIVEDVAERDCYRIAEIPMSGPVVVDVGAHIGCFAKRVHERNPSAQIVAVECCPENIPALRRNVGEFAAVVQAAVTYEANVSLLNSVYADCRSTGGSRVLPRRDLEQRVINHIPPRPEGQQAETAFQSGFAPEEEAEPIRIDEYWADFRPVATLTLEELMQRQGFDHIDILKLDCEGSEYSILGNSSSLEHIGLVVGEYHGREEFDRLVAERFAGWNLRILKDGHFGTFWLQNPTFSRNAQAAAISPVGENPVQPTATSPATHTTNGHTRTSTNDSPPAPLAHPRTPPAEPRGTVSVSFHHGLGDCAFFAHMLPLYVRRGYHVDVECTPDKRLLFEAAGAHVIPHGARDAHPWGYPASGTHVGEGRYWQGSKIANNLSLSPLPDIGPAEQLWDELCSVEIDIRPRLSPPSVALADKWFSRLPRPIVLLHTKGNTGQERKSLPDAIAAEFYQALLDRIDGSIILMDWDNRVPRLASYRVRHLDELGGCSTDVMLAMMAAADLVVGVDSGPLHACRFTQTPSVGIWMPGHYPSTYTLPRRQQLNIVLADHTRQWNRYKRIPWNLVEHPGSTFKAEILAEQCARMLSEPRYLKSGQIAADVQLQQFIREWCRGRTGNALSDYPDRHTSFDRLFREISRRFEQPNIVETGTIRAAEDWDGAGFFTYLAGAYLHRHGGKLHSVDLLPENCDFARACTQAFGETVSIHAGDSIRFLEEFSGPIDVLYLDSLDTTEPGHAEHAQRELLAAQPRLHERSLIVVDDSPWHAGAWIGKGSRVVPMLLQQGWKLIYGGYQVVLGRGDP